MTFDTTITIGNLLETVAFLCGGFVVIIRVGGDFRIMKLDMSHLKERVTDLTSAFDKMGSILTKVAVQDERMIQFEKRLEELAHGHGFVQRDINGEYPR